MQECFQLNGVEVRPGTRAAIDLLCSGRLARYPNIRYILPHGGGTVPFVAHRIVAGWALDDPAHNGDQGMGLALEESLAQGLSLLQGLYYDTASPGDAHLAALQEFVGPSHIVFGTDGGWTPPVQTAITIKTLMAYDGFDEAQMKAIERDNAAALFPRIKVDMRSRAA